jgi:translation initiation factor 3 subunit C
VWKTPLCSKIQEEGLRTYLFTYANIYSTLSLSYLSSLYSLPLSTTTSIVSKMIWDETLPASLDQVAGVVVLHAAAGSSGSGSGSSSREVSHLQRLALQLVDRAAQLTDNSERYLEAKLSQGEQRADGVRGGGGGDRNGGEAAGPGQQRERRHGGAGRGGGRGGRGGSRGGAVGRFNSGALGRTVQV